MQRVWRSLFVVAALVLWIAPSRQTSSAQDGIRPTGPLISRGYTDAPAGTAVIAGDPASGGVIQELRIIDGQKVKKDEVVAVLSNYSKADVTVRTTEAELQKAKRQREAMVNGYRTAEIAMQEVVVKSAAEELKLKTLEMTRSGKPPDQKQLELNISQQSLEREQAKLRVMKETLATDLAQIDIDISITPPSSTRRGSAASRRWSARRSTAWWCRSTAARASACRRAASSRSST